MIEITALERTIIETVLELEGDTGVRRDTVADCMTERGTTISKLWLRSCLMSLVDRRVLTSEYGIDAKRYFRVSDAVRAYLAPDDPCEDAASVTYIQGNATDAEVAAWQQALIDDCRKNRGE